MFPVSFGFCGSSQSSACKEAVAEYGDKIAVGIDALHGKVAAEGWIEQSEVDYITLAKEMEAVGGKDHYLY